MTVLSSTSASGAGATTSGAAAVFTGGGGEVSANGSGDLLLGALPFTGVNVFFLFLTAVTILLMGITMVRIGRNVTAERI